MVRITENGVFNTTAVSMGRFTYWLAFPIVMGRVEWAKPPRMPAIHTITAPAKTADDIKLPKQLKTPDEKGIKKIYDTITKEVVTTGNFEKLYELKSLIL